MARERRLALPAVTDFTATTGFGVSAVVDSRRVLVGRPSFLTEAGIDLAPVSEAISRLESEGYTVVAVRRDGQALGVIALADAIRPEAPDTVERLRADGLVPVLVTGDNPRAARHVAMELDIDEIYGGVLPDGKAELVRKFQAQGAKVAMVGDGINDPPALMQADVGIAMGGGTDIAIESSDVIIIRDDVSLVMTARDISRRAYRRVRQNVGLAFTFNGIGIPLAATGLVYPVWAMVAMAASVTTIFINSIGGRPALLLQAIRSVGTTGPRMDVVPAGLEWAPRR